MLKRELILSQSVTWMCSHSLSQVEARGLDSSHATASYGSVVTILSRDLLFILSMVAGIIYLLVCFSVTDKNGDSAEGMWFLNVKKNARFYSELSWISISSCFLTEAISLPNNTPDFPWLWSSKNVRYFIWHSSLVVKCIRITLFRMKYKMIKNNRFSFYTIDNPWDIKGGRDRGGVGEEWGG